MMRALSTVLLTVVAVELAVIVSRLPPHRAEAQTTVVRARRFEVVDQTGRVRGSFGIEKDGGTTLQVTDDPSSKQGVMVGVVGGVVPMVALFDKQGNARMELHIDSDGSPLLWFLTADGKILSKQP